MLIFSVVFLLCTFWSVKCYFTSFADNFLTKSSTDSIKGIFIIVVFMNHISEYYNSVGADLSAWYDKIFFLIPKSFGQLMVVMFLFYSGYGVMEGIKRKRRNYVNVIPKKRVLGTLVNFDVAVIVFAVTLLLLGMPFTWEQFLLSLIGWDSVGNSNWYIFVILVCYALTYAGQKINSSMGGTITTALIMVSAFILSFSKGTWWYNTMFAYGAGLLFSQHKDILITSMKSNYNKWLIGVALGFASCLGTYLYFYAPFKGDMQQLGALVFNFMSVSFAFFVVIITMRVHIGNKVLEWLGTNLFPLYIYQRLSMMVLTEVYPNDLVAEHPYLFFVICAAITIGIAWGYKWINIKIA